MLVDRSGPAQPSHFIQRCDVNVKKKSIQVMLRLRSIRGSPSDRDAQYPRRDKTGAEQPSVAQFDPPAPNSTASSLFSDLEQCP